MTFIKRFSRFSTSQPKILQFSHPGPEICQALRETDRQCSCLNYLLVSGKSDLAESLFDGMAANYLKHIHCAIIKMEFHIWMKPMSLMMDTGMLTAE